MNMAYNSDHDRMFDYRTEEEPAGREKIQRKARPQIARKRAPSSFNGMHRRRNKRFAW
jgi:hypothetical protein